MENVHIVNLEVLEWFGASNKLEKNILVSPYLIKRAVRGILSYIQKGTLSLSKPNPRHRI